MKAKLKNIMSSDVDLRTFRPEDENYFSIGVQLEIGAVDSSGADLFQIEVCSASWMREKRNVEIYINDGSSAVWGERPYLVVKGYSLETVVQYLDEYLENLDEMNWQKTAEKINEVALWEFEAYR